MPCSFFFFNDTATTEIYTLSLHDALPISRKWQLRRRRRLEGRRRLEDAREALLRQAAELCRRQSSDRKSTRLNSSHANISYAVFCLKKKTRRSQCKARARPMRCRPLQQIH